MLLVSELSCPNVAVDGAEKPLASSEDIVQLHTSAGAHRIIRLITCREAGSVLTPCRPVLRCRAWGSTLVWCCVISPGVGTPFGADRKVHPNAQWGAFRRHVCCCVRRAAGKEAAIAIDAALQLALF